MGILAVCFAVVKKVGGGEEDVLNPGLPITGTGCEVGADMLACSMEH